MTGPPPRPRIAGRGPHAILVLGLAGLLAGCGGPPPPTGRIVFVAGLGRTVELWHVSADGRNPVRLPTPARPERDPGVGFHGQPLPGPARASPFMPSWSPDGARIAFELSGTRFSEIWVMNADGTQPRRLVATTHGPAFQPKWSPDGTRIAFAVMTPSKRHDIFLVNADGGDPRNLTNTPDEEENYPAWSPDGRRILFTRARAIWVMDADGGNPGLLIPSRGGDNAAAAWAPDGGRIVYASNEAGSWDIWLFDLGGRRARNLTGEWPEQESDPVWSPDGREILFVADRGGARWQLWRMRADGSERRLFYRATDPPAGFNKFQPAWSSR